MFEMLEILELLEKVSCLNFFHV